MALESGLETSHASEVEVARLEQAAEALRSDFLRVKNLPIALGIEERARSLWLGVRHAVTGPSSAAAHVVARVQVELAITAAWIAQDPTKRLPRWVADSAANEERTIRLLAEVWEPARPLLAEPSYAQKKVLGKEPRLPDLASMASQVGVEADFLYRAGYRVLSAWTHVADYSFRETFQVTESGINITEAGPTADDALWLRQTSAYSFAYTIESVCSWSTTQNAERDAVRERARLLKVECGTAPA